MAPSPNFHPNNSSVKGCNEYQDRTPPERQMENTQDGTLEGWFKITIPYGMKCDKIWLMNSIQSHCSVPFTPVTFHSANNQARFFVQGASAASPLKDVSCKVRDDANQKIAIVVNTSSVPYSVQNKLESKDMELKLTINK